FALSATASHDACPPPLHDALPIFEEGLARAAAEGLRPDELSRAKEQLKGSLMLGLENTANRMSRIARAELFQEELLTPDRLIQVIDQVSPDDVHRVARTLYENGLIVAAVGPVDDGLARDLAAAGR